MKYMIIQQNMSHRRVSARKNVEDRLDGPLDVEPAKSFLVACNAGLHGFYMDPVNSALYKVGSHVRTNIIASSPHAGIVVNKLDFDVFNDIPVTSLVSKTKVRITDDQENITRGATVFTVPDDHMLYYNPSSNTLSAYSKGNGEIIGDDFPMTPEYSRGTLDGVVVAWKDTGVHPLCHCGQMPCTHYSHCRLAHLVDCAGDMTIRRNIALAIRRMP